MEEQIGGGCACGQVRYTATVRDQEAYLCHCRMCQKATGSVSIAFKNFQVAEVNWDGEPAWFDSSPIAVRPYCANCGTSLGFKFKEGSENMDLTVASFDDPSPTSPSTTSARKASIGTGSTLRACPRCGPRITRSWSKNGSKPPGAFPADQLAAVTRQIVLPASSATSRPPPLSIITPTGRP